MDALHSDVDPLRGLNVLVVDDDRDTRDLFTTTLRSFGAAVVAVANAASAVMALRRFAPDVVLADMRLPDGTGASVLRHARESKSSAAFIAVSGFDFDAGGLRAAGFDVCLRKPVDHDDLVGAILGALRGRRDASLRYHGPPQEAP